MPSSPAERTFDIATSYLDRRTPNAERKHRLNREIMASEVRLNGPENEPLGIVPLQEALRLAGEKDVDPSRSGQAILHCAADGLRNFKYQEQKRAAERRRSRSHRSNQ